MKTTGSFFVAIIFLAACTAMAAGLAGNWSGQSLCTMKDSPCHDEQVIYHITEPDSKGALKIQADKVVNGQPVDMGTLDCLYDKARSSISCQMSNGLWEFTVTGNTMKGTLKLPDGRVFRNVSVKKDDQN